MILVDTSVWVTHLNLGHEGLKERLREGEVAVHPFVIGELACGNIKNRQEVLSLLATLPRVEVATLEELLGFIEENELTGMGLGFVDVHLLASARLSGVSFWTEDKGLRKAAEKLGMPVG
jgi:predicted nucleic acid-binding protein